jgi:hypothetical protein
MWCVGRLTAEYRRRMYELLDLYARPYRADQPVICIDEKSKQLLRHSRQPLPLTPGKPPRVDYEYVRAGTCNIFVAVEPQGGQRVVQVTAQRGKVDFIRFAQHLIRHVYRSARRIHFVVDNLNIHFAKCFVETLGPRAAAHLLRRVVFHYTPKHASWLNMAETELSVLGRQCLDRRIAHQGLLKREVAAWERKRNRAQVRVDWQFTTAAARIKLKRLYPKLEPVN